MGAVAAPASTTEALAMLEAAWGFLADLDPATLPAPVLADACWGWNRPTRSARRPRGRMLAAFDAQDGPVAYGQRNIRTWLVHTARVTKGQASSTRPCSGWPSATGRCWPGSATATCTKSIALQLAKWTRDIPGGVPGPGRGDPDRRGPGRRGPAGAGRDLRGDPLPHRPARPAMAARTPTGACPWRPRWTAPGCCAGT